MIHLGFSYIGLIFLLMLFIPNGLWTKRKPENYEEYSKNENKILLLFERIGQMLVTVLVLVFADFNLRSSAWGIWLVFAFLCMILYEIFWVRYFKSSRKMSDYYGDLIGIPVPGATLPIIAFWLLGIYGCNILLILATIFLGIGHIGIHLQHAKEARIKTEIKAEINKSKEKKNKGIKVIKRIVCTICILIIGLISVVIGIKNYTYYKDAIASAKDGILEGTYVELDGQEQYVFIRGNHVNNPVIIYLHGGPTSPDSYITYKFTDNLAEDYTILAWDQRGCGRTYFKNIKFDPDNQTATFNQAISDLDSLVDYACERFGRDKVIIMGWSYGTLLGTQYVQQHPEKVDCYIGIGQFVSAYQSDELSYVDALRIAKERNDDCTKLENAFEMFSQSRSLVDMMNLRTVVMPYHKQEYVGNTTMYAILSPYFGMEDFKWFLFQLNDFETYFSKNQKLFDTLMISDLTNQDMNYEVPVYMISGTDDWTCAMSVSEEYYKLISAPQKGFYKMDGCGHGAQYDRPEEFGLIIHEILK